MQRGRYIVIEGPGYSGKSTVMRLVDERLRSRGIETFLTREPGGPDEAERIRESIFEKVASGEITLRQETDLFYIARIMNHEADVIPNVENGVWVLKDRDQMSTLEYQVLRGMSREELRRIHDGWYTKWGLEEPDLRLMLSITKETVLKRMCDRGDEGDPFDFKKDGVLASVEAYGAEALDIFRGKGMFSSNTEVVDANYPVEVVVEKCIRLIEQRFDLEEDGEQIREDEKMVRRGVER
jgi:dTMP kinase